MKTIHVGVLESQRRLWNQTIVVLMVLSIGLTWSEQSFGQSWVANGPGPTTGGQVEGITSQPVSGAIHTVLAHPTDANVLYAGGTNGGVWKTTNATSASPTWTPLTDGQSSLSIGAMAFDPTDGTSNTIIAGNGRYSSNALTGGNRNGLLRSTDGGSSWTPITGGGFLNGKNISGVVARGSTIIVSTNTADSAVNSNLGIFRSTDGGASFSQISNSGSGLPTGRSFDLVDDPTDPTVLYTSARDGSAATNGIYRSSDSGASWTKVSNATMDALVASSTNNLEMSVGNSGEVYAGILNNGVLAGLFRTGNSGATWTQLDLPVTHETGGDVGTNPGGEKPGGQGSIHFSIKADPTNANLVYIGGDRQPGPGEGGIVSFPNSIGAANYSGRLFRVDSSLAAGSQASVLTHRGGTSGNTSTVSNSSPHADSRDMVFDASGRLIEVDDGGIYVRTSPAVNNVGDWFSLNGNITTTEFHSIAWDSNSNIIFGGTQDTGTPEQIVTGGTTYRTVSQGDGGVVAVYNVGDGTSVRYTSFQFLGGLRRRVVDASNGVISTTFPSLTGISGSVEFYTPIQVNQFNGNLLIGTTANVFESTNGGTTVTAITDSSSFAVRAMDAGAVNNIAALWVGRSSGLALRDTPGGSLINVASFGAAAVMDLAMDENEYRRMVASTTAALFFTDNAGVSFADITGNLLTFGSDIWSVEMMSLGGINAVFAGLRTGDVYYSLSTGAGLGSWFLLGDLPNAPVRDLFYSSTDDILVAGLQGRGAFTFSNISGIVGVPEPVNAFLLVVVTIGLYSKRRRR